MRVTSDQPNIKTNMKTKIKYLFLSVLTLLALSFNAKADPVDGRTDYGGGAQTFNVFTVDGAQTYQTIDGFGANVNGNDPTNAIGPVLSRLVNDAGMTLFRVIKDREDWQPTAANDYSAYRGTPPQTNFVNLWSTIRYLNQLGISDGISISLMGQGPSWMSTNWHNAYWDTTLGFLRLDQTNNWADMIGDMLVYAKDPNGQNLQFHLIEPDNEPEQRGDNPWPTNRLRTVRTVADSTGTGRADCVSAYSALAAYFNNHSSLSDMKLIGPTLSDSTTNVIIPWVQTMLSDSTVSDKIAHIGTHHYGGVDAHKH
jgi:O-glycosyl hydrolase